MKRICRKLLPAAAADDCWPGDGLGEWADPPPRSTDLVFILMLVRIALIRMVGLGPWLGAACPGWIGPHGLLLHMRVLVGLRARPGAQRGKGRDC